MIKVKQKFIDRETGDTYHPGELYAGTAERIEELRQSRRSPVRNDHVSG